MKYSWKSVGVFNIGCALFGVWISSCATNPHRRVEAKPHNTEADSSQVPDSWYYPLGSTGAAGESGRGGSDIVLDTIEALEGSRSGTGSAGDSGVGGSGVGGSGILETPPGWIQSGPDSLVSDSAKGLKYLEYEDFNSRG